MAEADFFDELVAFQQPLCKGASTYKHLVAAPMERKFSDAVMRPWNPDLVPVSIAWVGKWALEHESWRVDACGLWVVGYIGENWFRCLQILASRGLATNRHMNLSCHNDDQNVKSFPWPALLQEK